MTPLRRRMIEDMRIRNLSPHTQRAYIEHVSRFARHFGQPPERLGPREIRAWQIHLVQERRLAASSISVAVAALRFVYTVTLRQPWIVEDDIPTRRQPKKLPVVPSPEEVAQFLDAVKSPKPSALTGTDPYSLMKVDPVSARKFVTANAGKQSLVRRRAASALRRSVGTSLVPTPPPGHGAQGGSKAPRAALRGGSGATRRPALRAG